MINTLFIDAKAASFEIINNSTYYTSEYNIYVNNSLYSRSNRNVFSIYDLEPNTTYKVCLKGCFIDFEFEFTTLNKKCILFKGNGNEIQGYIDNLKADEVLVIDGIYNVISLFLKDNTTIYLSKNSKLIGQKDRMKYPILKANEFLNGKPLGTWEGKADDCFASLITGLGVKNAIIYGEGIIDYEAQKSDWWINHRQLRVARRPKGIFLHTCNNITIMGVTVCNTPSWNQHPFYSNNINYIDVRLYNPEESPTTDGIDPESCDGVNVIGCIISVGDDCIAIKSGKIDFARKYKTPSSNIVIRNCLMLDGHGGVTLGSENSGGICNVNVSQCVFSSTDRGLRIKTQRTRGNLAVIKDINFNNIVMNDVKAPFVINAFYKAGNDEVDYRFDRGYREFDDETPIIKSFKFENIKCENVSYGLGYFLGLPESKIEEVVLKNVNVSYKSDAKCGPMGMTLENEKFLKVGIYAANVKCLILDNVNYLDEPLNDMMLDNVDKVVKI
jgi:polygalacturonase